MHVIIIVLPEKKIKLDIASPKILRISSFILINLDFNVSDYRPAECI